jgi:multidrug resistance efflux pump
VRASGRAALLGFAVALVVASSGCGSIALPWQAGSEELTASGTLEADEVVIAPRVFAVVTELPAVAGAWINGGDVAVKLDDRPVQLQIYQSLDLASKRLLELQAQDYTLRSPVSGIVTRVATHVGEMALPGQPLLAVSDLSTLKLTIYVREADLGRVAVGQQIRVIADPYPAQSFRGVVTSINERAEFTPRNVQTRSDRLNLVFGVQATIENADGALKPGMPVDATFEAAPAVAP